MAPFSPEQALTQFTKRLPSHRSRLNEGRYSCGGLLGGEGLGMRGRFDGHAKGSSDANGGERFTEMSKGARYRT